ncbi:MAG: serine/threonine-protein kinase [Bryobacteraceae bacterium]
MSISDGALDRLGGILEQRYEIEDEIGRGGMGIVYRAYDTVLQRHVALKTHDGRWQQEARVLAELEHPGIVPVHDAGTLADGRPFYAMKLVHGRPLDANGLSVAEALRLFLRICEPVIFAHARGIVHGDLKPTNVMIGAFGEVLVLDWGLACRLGEETTAAGTPAFMAPEPVRTERSDIYSLGKILTVLTPARRPSPVQAIIDHATETDPAGRFACVRDLAGEVARYVDGERVLCHGESIAQAAWRIAKRYQTVVALICAYLLMRVLLYFWLRR